MAASLLFVRVVSRLVKAFSGWIRLTHIMESNLLWSKLSDFGVNLSPGNYRSQAEIM